MKNSNEQQINNLYSRLIEKFGNECGTDGKRRFPVNKKSGINTRLYNASKYAIEVVSGLVKKSKPSTKELASNIVRLDVNVDDLIKFSDLANHYDSYKKYSKKAVSKSNSEKPKKKVKETEEVDVLQKTIDERVMSYGIVNTIDALEEIIERLRSKKNESLDKIRVLEQELYGDTLPHKVD